MTRDPIFLFQEGVIIENLESDTEYNYEHECLVISGSDTYVDDYDLLDMGWADIHWNTTGVFTTREEAERFGEGTSYRYGSRGKGVDWRVYCIALERDSVLAKLLNEVIE